jgi:hypothetical protein
MEAEIQENRKHPRYKTAYEVSCAAREFDGATKGYLADVSARGAAIKSGLSLKPGTEICLCIRPDNDQPPIFIDVARVCWVGGGIFGAEFVSIGRNHEKNKLHQFVETIAGLGLP